MKLTQLHALLNAADGVIDNLNLDFKSAQCVLELSNDQHSFRLEFQELKQIDLHNDFEYLGDFFEVTLCKKSGSFYLSLDPYEDDNKPSEFDDMVFAGAKLAVTIDGIVQTIE